MSVTETRRETANRIATNELLLSESRNVLADVIEAALKERDERAARITADILPIGADDCYWCERVNKAVTAIRNEDTDA